MARRANMPCWYSRYFTETSSLTQWRGVSGPHHVHQVVDSICTEGSQSLWRSWHSLS